MRPTVLHAALIATGYVVTEDQCAAWLAGTEDPPDKLRPVIAEVTSRPEHWNRVYQGRVMADRFCTKAALYHLRDDVRKGVIGWRAQQVKAGKTNVLTHGIPLGIVQRETLKSIARVLGLSISDLLTAWISMALDYAIEVTSDDDRPTEVRVALPAIRRAARRLRNQSTEELLQEDGDQ